MLPVVTTLLGAGEPEAPAEQVEESRRGVGLDRPHDTVHRQRDLGARHRATLTRVALPVTPILRRCGSESSPAAATVPASTPSSAPSRGAPGRTATRWSACARAGAAWS